MSITAQDIKSKALTLGFSGVGIARAEKIEGFSEQLDHWINLGYHAEMEYMARNREKRSDPTLLVDGAKSVISLVTTYFPKKLQASHLPQVAKYAYGPDYHLVLKDKMQLLWDFIKIHYPTLDGRIFVDSAPVSDKLWAVKAGLGWIGKNSCLISRDLGSFLFISELIVNIEFEYDVPYKSHFCGSCNRCIESCPTQAIVKPGVVNSNRCISYQTIENKNDQIPETLIGMFNNRLFGCDICQDVCPWNKSPIINLSNDFEPAEILYTLDYDSWSAMTEIEFKNQFKKSPISRAKYKGIRRNLDFIAIKKQ